MSSLENLINELYEWQREQDLPPMCAAEQLQADYVNEEQKKYLRGFIARWEMAEGV